MANKPTRAHNSLDELREHEHALMNGWWLNDGVWRKPRLVTSWEEIQVGKPVPAHTFSQEAFFFCLFACVFGQLRVQYSADDSMFMFVRQFLCVWSLLAFALDYATRFNDDDVPHKIFWTCYGMGMVGLLMHIPGDGEMFAMCASLTTSLIAVMHLRVAAHLPSCRGFALFVGLGLLANSALWALLTRQELARYWPAWPWWASTPHQWLTMVGTMVLPATCDVPMSLENLVAKVSGVKTIALGQMVFALAVKVSSLHLEHRRDVYVAAVLCFMILFDVKFLAFDTEQVPLSHHAITRCRRTALTWLLVCQPMMLFSVNLLAAGMGELMESLCVQAHRIDSLEVAHGVRTLCCGSAATLFSMFMTRMQHATGRAQRTSHRLRIMARVEGRLLLGLAILLCCFARCELLVQSPFLVLFVLHGMWAALGLLHMYEKQYLLSYLRHMDGPGALPPRPAA